MLYTLAVILLVLWLLGMVTGYTLGNVIYILLVIALVLFLVGAISGRRPWYEQPGGVSNSSAGRPERPADSLAPSHVASRWVFGKARLSLYVTEAQ
jgi:uncharacterized protein (DUF58 family)